MAKIQLSRLRAIGWSTWDPIGIRDPCENEDGCVDEYDSYLLHVVSTLHSHRIR
jgi:hypothetical protein